MLPEKAQGKGAGEEELGVPDLRGQCQGAPATSWAGTAPAEPCRAPRALSCSSAIPEPPFKPQLHETDVRPGSNKAGLSLSSSFARLVLASLIPLQCERSSDNTAHMKRLLQIL